MLPDCDCETETEGVKDAETKLDDADCVGEASCDVEEL